MFSLGPLAFAAPWALAALIALPAIWWLLRLTPPVPTRVAFPPIRLLLGLVSERQTSARTPWWLLALRLLIAALIIIAAARPVINAEPEIGAGGPVVIVIDNGWAAAERWAARRDVALSLADRAVRAGRRVVALPTAPPPDGSAIAVMASGAAEVRAEIAKLIPVPWPSDRGQALEALLAWAPTAGGLADIRWLSDGLDSPGAETLAERLRGLGRVTIYGAGEQPVTILRPPSPSPNGLEVTIERSAAASQSAEVKVRGLDADGRVVSETPIAVAANAAQAAATIAGPAEILNRIERLQIGAADHAGQVVLLDQRWQRRPVGIIDVDGATGVQPLLSNSYYLSRALEGSTTVRTDGLEQLFTQPMSVLIAPDGFEMTAAEVGRIDTWARAGGVFVRFAGPVLARRTGETLGSDTTEPLLPVTIRAGDRVIGGAMSWRQPMPLDPFPAKSPFFGLQVPSDVRVSRQVLAQPTPDLAEKTWAALADGTPLVTAERRGQGWIVLFHTAANASWSNLPISGVFVEMMQRLTALGQGVQGGGETPPLAPERIMDGFGRLGAPSANVQPVTAAAIDSDPVSAQNPPGIYGNADLRRAFNLTTSLPTPQALPIGPEMTRAGYDKPLERDLTAGLFAVALALLLIDTVVGLWVRTGGARRGAVAAAVLLSVCAAQPAAADDRFDLANTLETRLAYLKTGDGRVDDVSALGLTGLTVMLARRTAAELGPPQAVEPGRDVLAFFPLIYWPVTPGYTLDDVAALAVKEYLRDGGTILFDTQDRGGGEQAAALRDLAQTLDLPQLVPVSPGHVLTRAFYLMNDFPGRYAGLPLWVERSGERVNDGVSPVVAGSADWAAAWALDEAQRPIYPVVPGGERQREMAYRFGINLVMYVLTGNYKADQVHLPAILKRLGQ